MLSIIKKVFKPSYYILGLAIFALTLAQTLCDLYLPEKLAEIVTYIQQGAPSTQIWNTGLLMLLVALAGCLCSVIISYIASRVGAGFSARARSLMFSKIQGFSLEEMNKFSTASLITRSTNDVQQVQLAIIMGLRVLLMAPIMAVGATVKILQNSAQLSITTAIVIVILIVVMSSIFMVVLPKFNKVQKLTDDVNRITRESLTGIKVIRAFHAEDIQEKKFEKTNQELTKTNIFVNKALNFMQPFTQFLINGLNLSIVWVGAYLVNSNPNNLAIMTSFTGYAMQLLMSFLMVIMAFVFIPRAAVSARRMNEVLTTTPKIHDPETPQTTPQNGEICFNDVTFNYPDAEENVLEHISFTAKKGETIAFIGSTGSGKSTLINLLMRFYDVTQGSITLNGVDIREYSQHELHERIGYVPQKSVLLSGTVAENIAYGKPEATQEEIETSARIAEAEEFITQMPKGYQSYISQGGKNVSGGQKQRLSIARAIIKQPEIIIFDDSFSALDYKTDKKVRANLNEHLKDSTKLIVAQRIGTIMDADTIIVLDQGKIVGKGTHKQLLKSCKVYQEIAHSQLSKEELNA